MRLAGVGKESSVKYWGILCLALALSLGGVACGDDDSDSEGGNGSAENNSAENNSAENNSGDGGDKIVWGELDFEGKRAFMSEEVTPQMKEVFAAFNPSYGENFQCATCHGEDLAGGAFTMPHTITPLNGEELAAFSYEGERLEVAMFMANEVVPKMATLLGQEPFNPATGEGTFGCGSCHAIE